MGNLRANSAHNKSLKQTRLAERRLVLRYSALYLELYGIFNSDFIDLSLRDI